MADVLASVLCFAIMLWAIGRAGPMSWRTRKADVAALVSIAAGTGGIGAFRLFGVVPPIELVLMANAGLVWWFYAAPVSARPQAPLRKRPTRAAARRTT